MRLIGHLGSLALLFGILGFAREDFKGQDLRTANVSEHRGKHFRLIQAITASFNRAAEDLPECS